MIIHKRLLHDAGIRKAVKNGVIKFSNPVSDNQYQPASLDIRIGNAFIYDQESYRLAQEYLSAQQKKKSFSIDTFEMDTRFAKKYDDVDNVPILIPSRARAELYFHEQIRTEFDMSYELRSSRGRLGLVPQNIFIQNDGHGQYISLVNHSPNSIILYGQSKFAQIFFHPKKTHRANGAWMTDPLKVGELFSEFDSKGLILPDGRLVFTVGDSLLRMRKMPEPIDTRKPSPENLYEKISLKKPYVLSPHEVTIVSLMPALSLDDRTGVRLLWRNNSSDGLSMIDGHVVSAGWVDPNYKNTVTAHPIKRGLTQRIKEGDPFVTGQVYRYFNAVSRSYGSSGLGNHYSGDSGGLSGSRS
ncbi:MAG TPA: 2'-deoxycytidine 5'-triphosphate deaminase [Acidobacteriota bacterium]|nr:2'-deoxycytidine 5'-triphosphate deaminase [Acidobacteriota bacterium]